MPGLIVNPCSICLDEQCGGKRTCNCETCKVRSECPRYLHPTIRITTKCTQSCSHCCYSCSPQKSDMMSVETAREIGQFLKANEILAITIMGGEFYCNPDWKEIFHELLSETGVAYVRLVTNGDWAQDRTDEVLDVLEAYKSFLKVSISMDRWHTNAHVGAACTACATRGFYWNSTTEEEDSETTIVPVGRSAWDVNFFALFSCFCHDETHKYGFLIDEKGTIYKCGMGVWDYAEVQAYLDGGFRARFKEFNQEFYSVFMSNCKVCLRMYQRTQQMSEEEKDALMKEPDPCPQ